MTEVRIAETKDLEGVLALYAELRPKDPKLTDDGAQRAWQDLLGDKHTYLIVADVEGVVASTCQLSLNPTITNGARPFAIIEHVVTGEHFRRRGLSFRVMARALELAWQLNCYKVMLLSGEKRPEAHKLYEKLGFVGGVERGYVIKPNTLDS